MNMKTFEQFLFEINKYGLDVTSENLARDFLYANGCGAKGGIKFPPTMWLLNIESACNAHDIGWQNAKSLKELQEENEKFDNNLKLIIDKESNFVMKRLRRLRAAKYVTEVELLGTKAYAKERCFNL